MSLEIIFWLSLINSDFIYFMSLENYFWISLVNSDFVYWMSLEIIFWLSVINSDFVYWMSLVIIFFFDFYQTKWFLLSQVTHLLIFEVKYSTIQLYIQPSIVGIIHWSIWSDIHLWTILSLEYHWQSIKMATGPDTYKDYYHITEWGDVIITGEGNPIKKNISLDDIDPSDLFTISPSTLWDSKKTRSNSALFQPGNTQPYNPNKADRMLYTTQMAVNLMASKLGNLEMHESKLWCTQQGDSENFWSTHKIKTWHFRPRDNDWIDWQIKRKRILDKRSKYHP